MIVFFAVIAVVWLARVHMEMSPYKSLPLPFLGTTLHWGR